MSVRFGPADAVTMTAPAGLLDDLAAAHTAAAELVLMARQLCVLVEALHNGVGSVTVPAVAGRPALEGVAKRLLRSSRRTVAVMQRRVAQTESAGDILRRSGSFARTARDLAAARATCAQLCEDGGLDEPARAFVEAAYTALTAADAAFARQRDHWCVLRQLLQRGERAEAVRDVFLAALPESTAAPDYTFELVSIARRMRLLAELERRLEAEVRLARAMGASWVKIGGATGITPQGAYRRWDEVGHQRGRQV